MSQTAFTPKGILRSVRRWVTSSIRPTPPVRWEDAVLPERINPLIAELQDSGAGADAFAGEVSRGLAAAFKQSHPDDVSEVKQRLEGYLRQSEHWQVIFRQMLEEVDTWEKSRARRERFSERWWQEERRALQEAFDRDPQEGTNRWVQTYADALVAWELDTCQKLIREGFPFPATARGLVSVIALGTVALKAGNYRESLEALETLTQATTSQFAFSLDEVTRALLFIFMGRIHLYTVPDSTSDALKQFERAKNSAPNDGRVYAALGDYHRSQGDASQALRLYQQGIERSPDQADGYRGMGLLSEDQERWDEVEEWYDRALAVARVEKDLDAALSKLLAPVSGNLYLQMGAMLQKEDPLRALAAVERAIGLQIKGPGLYPERVGYRLQGMILETLGRHVEAAEAYYEAGRRFGWADELETAVGLLTRANDLNPKYVPTYWDLSDVLRMRSYVSSPPYVDKSMIDQSLAVWMKGAQLQDAQPELLDAEYSWSYVTRALINEQLARIKGGHERVDLWWEAVAYLERAILLLEVEVGRWALLGRFHRFLRNESNALQATNKALEFDSSQVLALDERAAILANAGQFSEAESVIDRRLGLEPSLWADGIKAFTLLGTKRYQEAAALLDKVLSAIPEDLWYHEIRAASYLMLRDHPAARKDLQWIWDRRTEPGYAHDQSTFGSAAYFLAILGAPELLDASVEILSALENDPSQASFASRILGLAYLARGDLAAGEESLEKGFELATNVRELDELSEDLTQLQAYLTSQPHGPQVTPILQRLSDKIPVRRERLQHERPPQEELEQILSRHEGLKSEHTWARVGAQAGLARVYTGQERWGDAERMYRLLSESQRFREAVVGLAKSFDGGEHRVPLRT